MSEVVELGMEGATAVLTLNRPEVHNALNGAVLDQLANHVAALQGKSSVRAIVITGAGERSFCAGADLDELSGLSAAQATETLRRGQRVMSDMAASRIPVIAAVNGVALGGGFELALAATFAIVSERASFALPESGLGLIPGYGGTQRLPRAIGRSAAAYFMLTGERLSAARAHDLGLAPLPPVPPADLMRTALEVAGHIAIKGPGATATILDCLSTSAATDADLEHETVCAGRVTASPEAVEGINAFKARRTPDFSASGGAA